MIKDTTASSPGAPEGGSPPTAKSGTRRELQSLLKQGGPQEATELAAQLGVTAMAVRQHLYDLQSEGLAASDPAPRERGRPAKRWRLTGAADALFPDGHQELAVDLIQSVRSVLGEEAMQALLRARAEKQTAAYRDALAKADSLESRVQALADIRSREGYMASVSTQSDGALQLTENHCPVCAAARACTGLCEMELSVFQNALGPDVTVERTDHILAGARRCAYRVVKSN